jgi:hypothetical protein
MIYIILISNINIIILIILYYNNVLLINLTLILIEYVYTLKLKYDN